MDWEALPRRFYHEEEKQTPMPNPVVHFEIGCQDLDKTDRFYSTLFGWSSSQMGPARMISTGTQEGISGHYTAMGHPPHHYTIFYVQVEDIAAMLAKAESLGGKTVVPNVDVPNYGSFAWFTDVDANMVGLWTPLHS